MCEGGYMNKEEIMAGNVLIAEFMGFVKEDKFYKYIEWDENSDDFGGQFYIEPQNMYFNTSWDWIMPVVEKINEIDNFKFRVEVCYKSCYIWDGDVQISVWGNCESTIIAVYKAVVEFIKWYNVSQKGDVSIGENFDHK